jgi:dethiobiotin synthetase
VKSPLSKPGLFITGTDTGVGKTIVTCAIAALLRARGAGVGVCKPVATGCRRDREGLVSEDAEALAHFSDCRLPLAVINPIRYHAPLAPAVAAERETPEGDDDALASALCQLDKTSDVILIEGVGGVLVPIGEHRTVLDLMRIIGYPVVVVTRATLGTLNHTALTCRVVRDAGLQLAGLVINRYHPDTADLVETTNPRWLAKQNDTLILATIPEAPEPAPHLGQLPPEVIDAVSVTDWRGLCRPPNPRSS